jgi:hypothetical protein
VSSTKALATDKSSLSSAAAMVMSLLSPAVIFADSYGANVVKVAAVDLGAATFVCAKPAKAESSILFCDVQISFI